MLSRVSDASMLEIVGVFDRYMMDFMNLGALFGLLICSVSGHV